MGSPRFSGGSKWSPCQRACQRSHLPFPPGRSEPKKRVPSSVIVGNHSSPGLESSATWRGGPHPEAVRSMVQISVSGRGAWPSTGRLEMKKRRRPSRVMVTSPSFQRPLKGATSAGPHRPPVRRETSTVQCAKSGVSLRKYSVWPSGEMVTWASSNPVETRPGS